MSDDQLWQKLERQFSDLRDLFDMRLETKTEAIGTGQRKKGSKSPKWRDTAPRWQDEDAGGEVRSWLLIPYIHALDHSHLAASLELGRKLIPTLDRHFEARQLSASFLVDWGMFCTAAGALQLAYLSQPDPGRLREAQAGGEVILQAQRRWFSHYCLRALQDHKTLSASRDAVERLINLILDGEQPLPPGFKVGWFEKFLNLEGSRITNDRYSKLTKEFTEKLTLQKMQELAKAPKEDLPSLDYEIPAAQRKGPSRPHP